MPRLLERVLPAQAGEAGQVTIQRAESQSVLDGEGCQVGVGDEVRSFRLGIQERAEYFAVPFAGLGNPHGRAVEPHFHLLPGTRDGLGTGKDARIRNETDKSQQTGPRQADGGGLIQLLV